MFFSCRKVYVAALASLLMAVATGLVAGFPVMALVDMDRRDSPIQPSTEMKTWIASIADIGEFLGCLLAAPISDPFGRRKGLMITAIPFVVGWCCITLAETEWVLIFGRIITGICCGLSMAIVPAYLVEIASPEIRGLLGACFQVFYILGSLLSNIVGWFIPWNKLSIVSCAMPIASCCILWFMPESPRWLVSKGHQEKAIGVFQFLHGSSLDPIKEVAAIEEDLRAQSEEERFRLVEFKKKIFWKPTVLSLMLMVFKEISGMGIFLYFTVEIFKSAKTTVNSNLSAVIVSSSHTIVTMASATIMDRVGRRILLTISAIGMSVFMSVLGAFFFLQEHHTSVHIFALNYVPLISITGFISLYSVGFGPIPWVMMSEMSPLKARGVICALTTCCNSITSFMVTKTFYNLQSSVGTSVTYWIYGGCSLISVLFVWCCLPETKGKPLENILECFK